MTDITSDLERVLEKVPDTVRDFIREEIEAREVEANRIADDVLKGVRETFTPEEFRELSEDETANLEHNLASLREVLRDVFFAGCGWQGRRMLESLRSRTLKPEEIN